MSGILSPVTSKKIVWLASYPKSGNTWFRLFLTALLGDNDLDINDMKTDGIFSSRSIFDWTTDLDSRYLQDEEVKNLIPDVFNHIATDIRKNYFFVKVHDAYTYNSIGFPIMPTESTLCALYFLRNPLDIAASLANHNGTSIDEAIKLMNNTDGRLARQKDNLNINHQISQKLLDWSKHVDSWTNDPPFPVMIVRYEDMLADTLNTFTKATSFIGIDTNKEKIQQALYDSKFEKLKEKETKAGFKENIGKGGLFFRKGTAGNWQKELTSIQIESIINHHKKTMTAHNYYEQSSR